MYDLALGLHACVVGETPILLDENSGRYFLIRGETGEQLTRHLRSSAEPSDERILLQKRLIERVDTRGTLDRKIAFCPPCHSYESDRDTSISGRLMVHAAVAQLNARLQIRRWPRENLFTKIRKLSAVAIAEKRSRARVTEAQIARTFHLLQFIIPSTDQCLARSIAIAQMLFRSGHHPSVVVGVQLPIAGHCWVQCHDRVVGDTLERVRAFQPIFAT